MANLKVKDQYTNVEALNGVIRTTTDAPTSKFKIGDSISQIGVKDGALCLDTAGLKTIDAGMFDRFTVAITNTGAVIDINDFINAIKPYNNIVWNPQQITTTAWYDASDLDTITQSLGKVSKLNDKSGNGRHMLQGNGLEQP